MSNPRKKISVVSEMKIGVISNLREQLVNLAKKKRTSIAGLAKDMDVTKQYLYALIGAETIKDRHLDAILKALKAKHADLKVTRPE